MTPVRAVMVAGQPAEAIRFASSRCFDDTPAVRSEAISQLHSLLSRHPNTLSLLRPAAGRQCTLPWPEVIVQLFAHRQLVAEAANPKADVQGEAGRVADIVQRILAQVRSSCLT